MKVTNVKFNYFSQPTDKGITKALGQVTLDSVLTINFSLKEGQHGPFISLGNDRKGKDGKYYSCVFAGKAFYQELVDAIQAAYDKQHNAEAKVASKAKKATSKAAKAA